MSGGWLNPKQHMARRRKVREMALLLADQIETHLKKHDPSLVADALDAARSIALGRVKWGESWLTPEKQEGEA